MEEIRYDSDNALNNLWYTFYNDDFFRLLRDYKVLLREHDLELSWRDISVSFSNILNNVWSIQSFLIWFKEKFLDNEKGRFKLYTQYGTQKLSDFLFLLFDVHRQLQKQDIGDIFSKKVWDVIENIQTYMDAGGECGIRQLQSTMDQGFSPISDSGELLLLQELYYDNTGRFISYPSSQVYIMDTWWNIVSHRRANRSLERDLVLYLSGESNPIWYALHRYKDFLEFCHNPGQRNIPEGFTKMKKIWQEETQNEWQESFDLYLERRIKFLEDIQEQRLNKGVVIPFPQQWDSVEKH